MRIIVEGMDNSGKTHLVKTLSREFDIPLIHSPGPCTEEKYAHWLEETENLQSVIFDRHPYISEAVYSILRPEAVDLGFPHPNTLVNRHTVIYCRPSDGAIYNGFAERRQMGGVRDNLQELLDRYDRLFMKFPKKDFLIYDYTADPGYFRIKREIYRKLYVLEDGLS